MVFLRRSPDNTPTGRAATMTSTMSAATKGSTNNIGGGGNNNNASGIRSNSRSGSRARSRKRNKSPAPPSLGIRGGSAAAADAARGNINNNIHRGKCTRKKHNRKIINMTKATGSKAKSPSRAGDDDNGHHCGINKGATRLIFQSPRCEVSDRELFPSAILRTTSSQSSTTGGGVGAGGTDVVVGRSTLSPTKLRLSAIQPMAVLQPQSSFRGLSSPSRGGRGSNKRGSTVVPASLALWREPNARWKSLSEQAGSHRQDGSVLRVVRHMTPAALRSGMPVTAADRVKELHIPIFSSPTNTSSGGKAAPICQSTSTMESSCTSSPMSSSCGGSSSGGSSVLLTRCFQEQQDNLPEWLDVVAETFFNLEHLYLTVENNNHNSSNGPMNNQRIPMSPTGNRVIEDPLSSKDEDERDGIPGGRGGGGVQTPKRHRVKGDGEVGETSGGAPGGSGGSAGCEPAWSMRSTRLLRLYVLYRLPGLHSIDGVTVTERERSLARPKGPNGNRVDRKEWIENNNVDGQGQPGDDTGGTEMGDGIASKRRVQQQRKYNQAEATRLQQQQMARMGKAGEKILGGGGGGGGVGAKKHKKHKKKRSNGNGKNRNKLSSSKKASAGTIQSQSTQETVGDAVEVDLAGRVALSKDVATTGGAPESIKNSKVKGKSKNGGGKRNKGIHQSKKGSSKARPDEENKPTEVIREALTRTDTEVTSQGVEVQHPPGVDETDDRLTGVEGKSLGMIEDEYAKLGGAGDTTDDDDTVDDDPSVEIVIRNEIEFTTSQGVEVQKENFGTQETTDWVVSNTSAETSPLLEVSKHNQHRSSHQQKGCFIQPTNTIDTDITSQGVEVPLSAVVAKAPSLLNTGNGFSYTEKAGRTTSSDRRNKTLDEFLLDFDLDKLEYAEVESSAACECTHACGTISLPYFHRSSSTKSFYSASSSKSSGLSKLGLTVPKEHQRVADTAYPVPSYPSSDFEEKKDDGEGEEAVAVISGDALLQPIQIAHFPSNFPASMVDIEQLASVEESADEQQLIIKDNSWTPASNAPVVDFEAFRNRPDAFSSSEAKHSSTSSSGSSIRSFEGSRSASDRVSSSMPHSGSRSLSSPQTPSPVKRIPLSESLTSPFPMQFRVRSTSKTVEEANKKLRSSPPRTLSVTTKISAEDEIPDHPSPPPPPPPPSQQRQSSSLENVMMKQTETTMTTTATPEDSFQLTRARSSPSKLIDAVAASQRRSPFSSPSASSLSNSSPLKNDLPPPCPGRRTTSYLTTPTTATRRTSKTRNKGLLWRQKLSARTTSIIDNTEDDDDDVDVNEDNDNVSVDAHSLQ